MKKYLLGLTAAAFILGTSAFTSRETDAASSSKRAGLHWYYKSPATGLYSSQGQSEEAPDISCPEVENNPEVCLKGFTNAQNASLINDATVAQQEIQREEM